MKTSSVIKIEVAIYGQAACSSNGGKESNVTSEPLRSAVLAVKVPIHSRLAKPNCQPAFVVTDIALVFE